MHRKMKTNFWLLILALALAGCGVSETSQPVILTTEPALETPAAASPVVPSGTPTFVPTLLPTDTELPTPSETVAPQAVMERLPAGQEVLLASIDMFSEKQGWGIGGLNGASDHILRTTDGGLSWQDITPAQPFPLETEGLVAIGSFLDAQTAWVFFTHQDGRPLQPANVWRSTDGGVNWQASQQLDLRGIEWNFYVSNLQFTDQLNGWLLAHVGVGMNHDYVMLFRSQDGGASWRRLLDPYTDGNIQACYKPGMLFTDALHGWLPVDCNGVMPGALLYYTADGGSTWAQLDLPAPADQPALFENYAVACGVVGVDFISPQFGRAGVSCTDYDRDPPAAIYYLYTTQDGGASWTSAPYPGGKPIFLSAEEGWTQNGDIYHTTNGGAGWTKISIVSWQGQFDFVSNQQVWAVARAEDALALVHSQDGGVYWGEIQTLIAP